MRDYSPAANLVRRGRRTLRICREFVRFKDNTAYWFAGVTVIIAVTLINHPSFASQNPPPFQEQQLIHGLLW